MRENFEVAFEAVIGHEGGFQANPKDPGNYVNGRLIGTKFGISARSYPKEDIPNLTLERAKEIYLRDYWGVMGDVLPTGLDYLYFDAAVNHGPGTSTKFLQDAVGTLADGSWGPNSKAALAAVIASDEVDDAITDFCIARDNYYEDLRTYSTFENGWRRRTFETHAFALFLYYNAVPLDQSKEEPAPEILDQYPRQEDDGRWSHWFKRI